LKQNTEPNKAKTRQT